METGTKIITAILLIIMILGSITTYSILTSSNPANPNSTNDTNSNDQLEEEICESELPPATAPYATFYVTPSILVINQPVNFLDASKSGTSKISNWSWAFGDGQKSISTNPTYVYSTAGEKTVTLKITAEDGSTSTTSRTIHIASSVDYASSFAEFVTSTSSPFVSETIAFTDTSYGEIGQWYWDFGDGASSTAQNPTYVYHTAGEKTITLVVTDATFRTSTVTHTLTVNEPIGPVASLMATPSEPIVNQMVVFNCTTHTGSGAVNQFLWNFGDGTTSTIHHPTHIYSTEGAKTVSLTVTDIYGKTSSATQTIYISAG